MFYKICEIQTHTYTRLSQIPHTFNYMVQTCLRGNRIISVCDTMDSIVKKYCENPSLSYHKQTIQKYAIHTSQKIMQLDIAEFSSYVAKFWEENVYCQIFSHSFLNHFEYPTNFDNDINYDLSVTYNKTIIFNYASMKSVTFRLQNYKTLVF